MKRLRADGVEETALERKERKDIKKALKAEKELLILEAPVQVEKKRKKKRRKIDTETISASVNGKEVTLENQDEEMEVEVVNVITGAGKELELETPLHFKLNLPIKQPVQGTTGLLNDAQKQLPPLRTYAKVESLSIPGLTPLPSPKKQRTVIKKEPVVPQKLLQADDDAIFSAILSIGLKSKKNVDKVTESSKGKGKEIVDMEMEVEKTPEELKAERKAAKKLAKQMLLDANSPSTSLLEDLKSFQAAIPVVERVIVEKRLPPKITREKEEAREKAKGKKPVLDSLEMEKSTTTAEILASKWLSAKKLKEFEKDREIIIKRGKFSFTEGEALTEAIEAFKLAQGLSKEQIAELVASNKNEGNAEKALAFQNFYSFITRSVENRPISAIYAYIKRTLDPNMKGIWTTEEDEKLKAAQVEHGNKWKIIGSIVGRSGESCKDRFRNKLVGSSEAVGVWSEEEEEELRAIMAKPESWIGGSPRWTGIAEALGGRRTRHQIRIKWTDALQKRLPGEKAGAISWTNGHSARLVRFVKSQKVTDASEIDWKKAAETELLRYGPNNLLLHWKRIHTQASVAIQNDKFSKCLRWAFKQYDDINISSKSCSQGKESKIEKVKPVSKSVKLPTFTSAEFITSSDDESDEE